MNPFSSVCKRLCGCFEGRCYALVSVLSNADDAETVEKVSREEIKRNSKQRNTWKMQTKDLTTRNHRWCKAKEVPEMFNMWNARTVFEVRTNMLKLNSSYGQKDETCHICGENETTKHIFECKGNKDYHLTNLKWILSANFKPKRTAAVSRGFLATAQLSYINQWLQFIVPRPTLSKTFTEIYPYVFE